MKQKTYLNLNQLITLLKDRGLIFVNETQFKYYLKIYNYENIINGYSDFFMTHHNKASNTYWKGTTDLQILNLFNFDKSIYPLFLSEILEIERKLSSLISFYVIQFAVNKNVKNAIDGNILKWNDKDFCFVFNKLSSLSKKDKAKHLTLQDKIKSFKSALIKNCLSKKHLQKYSNDNFVNMPFWKLVLYFSFKTSIKVFKYLHIDVKQNIFYEMINTKIPLTKKNGITKNKELINSLISVLTALNMLRNIICHNNVLYNFTCDDFPNDINYFWKFINLKNKKKEITNKYELRLGDMIKVIEFFNQNSQLSTLVNQAFDFWMLNKKNNPVKVDFEIIKKVKAFMNLN